MAKQFIKESTIVDIFIAGNDEVKAMIIKEYPFLDIEGLVNKVEAERAASMNVAVEGRYSNHTSGRLAIPAIPYDRANHLRLHLEELCAGFGINDHSIELLTSAALTPEMQNRGLYLSNRHDWRLFKHHGGDILVPYKFNR